MLSNSSFCLLYATSKWAQSATWFLQNHTVITTPPQLADYRNTRTPDHRNTKWPEQESTGTRGPVTLAVCNNAAQHRTSTDPRSRGTAEAPLTARHSTVSSARPCPAPVDDPPPPRPAGCATVLHQCQPVGRQEQIRVMRAGRWTLNRSTWLLQNIRIDKRTIVPVWENTRKLCDVTWFVMCVVLHAVADEIMEDVRSRSFQGLARTHRPIDL